MSRALCAPGNVYLTFDDVGGGAPMSCALCAPGNLYLMFDKTSEAVLQCHVLSVLQVTCT